jgi:beta-lactam-binding protein with PASTA domain
MSYAAAVNKLRKAGFTVETSYIYSNRPKGTGLGWSPGPGSYTSQFGTIYWMISKGRDPAEVAAEKKKARDAKKKAAEERKKKKEKGNP